MTEKITAIVSQDEDKIELVIRRAMLPAGVDGPIFSHAVNNMDTVDVILKTRGLHRVEAWKMRRSCTGMTLEAELVKL